MLNATPHIDLEGGGCLRRWAVMHARLSISPSLSASSILHTGRSIIITKHKFLQGSAANFDPIGLCRRRGWQDPTYECYRDPSGYTCLVLVNGREYQTDISYESDVLAQENAAMRAFMVCRNFSVNGGMLARNGVVQGLPANDSGKRKKSRHVVTSSHGHRESRHHRSGHHSSSSSTASFE